MKKMFLIYTAILIQLCLSSCRDEVEFRGSDCIPTDLQSDIIGFYDFNDGSLIDDSGFNANLTNSTLATSTADRAGNSNCAFLFDNTGTQEQFLSSPVSSQLDNLNEFSISAWYMPHPSDSSVLQGIVSRNDTIATSCPDRRGEWSLSLYDCKKAVLGHNNSAWANLDINLLDCDEQMTRLDDIWHHAVAVKDGDNYRIYYNGVLQSDNQGDAQCGSNLRRTADIGDLFIGKNFTGALDDIIIYKKALNDSEVLGLFGLEACCE